jgi:hypothetical protein
MAEKNYQLQIEGQPSTMEDAISHFGKFLKLDLTTLNFEPPKLPGLGAFIHPSE